MTAPDKQELLPCPFCSSGCYSIDNDARKLGYAVYCAGCLTQSPRFETEIEAANHWNTRPKSGEVVLSITQAELMLLRLIVRDAHITAKDEHMEDIYNLLTVIRSQTGGAS